MRLQAAPKFIPRLAVVSWSILASAGAVIVQAAPPNPDEAAAAERAYQRHVVPLLQKYCYECHGNGRKKGSLALDSFKSAADAAANAPAWQKVLENVGNQVMPPPQKRQPSPAETRVIAHWVETFVFHCDCKHPDPGRVTIRRLNRAEYNNTIRDLVGVNFQPADDFPSDDTGYGFDNIGDVLSVAPLLLEKYLAAAEKVLDAAIVVEDRNSQRERHFEADQLEGSAPGERVDGGARRLSREGDIYVDVVFPEAGDYVLRARAYGEQFGSEPPRMTFRLGDRELRTFDVPVTATNLQSYEVRLKLPKATNRFSVAYINNYVKNDDPDPAKRGDRNLVVAELQVLGPLDRPLPPLPPTHERIFFRQAASGSNQLEYAAQILARFLPRAYRRPVAPDEIERLLPLVQTALKQGDRFERGVKLALEAVLVSPHFLFRGELQPEPDNPQSVHPVDEYALASRLSYFLWSTMPDEELFALAERRKLRRQLPAQVKRMLQSPRSRALVDNFTGQWLQLRNLQIVTPDSTTFPDFDETLRAAMQHETELFVEDLIRNDRSVLEFLDADYTFVNERLARHYGFSGVTGDQFQRVSLKGTRRAGVLTQGSILTLTSNPTRSSPVKRGKYVLENLLGAPPPPPPPDVPELKETKLTGTLRQRMEQHRSNPSCAACHARMDPIGFGLENFDGVGVWRDTDASLPIDASGQLVSGETFQGPTELLQTLSKQKREAFLRCLTEKLLTYALGRGLELHDKCALEEITRAAASKRYRFSSLVMEIVKSAPFQQRRGEAAKSPTAAAALSVEDR